MSFSGLSTAVLHNCGHSKGAFTNYVDKILSVFDHVCMRVDKFITLNVDKNGHFFDHVCMSSCPRRLWMVPTEMVTKKAYQTINAVIEYPRLYYEVPQPCVAPHLLSYTTRRLKSEEPQRDIMTAVKDRHYQKQISNHPQYRSFN